MIWSFTGCRLRVLCAQVVFLISSHILIGFWPVNERHLAFVCRAKTNQTANEVYILVRNINRNGFHVADSCGTGLFLEHSVDTSDKHLSRIALNDCWSKGRGRIKGRRAGIEGKVDAGGGGGEEHSSVDGILSAGLMVSTRKIEIFLVIQGWPHFSFFPFLSLSPLSLSELSKGLL